MLSFHRSYFLLSLLLFAAEIFIGARMHDAIIRPYGGDFLVVILLYCLVRSCTNFPIVPAALSVLVFSYIVETLQYFHFADALGFTRPSLMRILLGTYFTWTDILSYTLGIALVLALEFLFKKPSTASA
jgi:hypothetical protein